MACHEAWLEILSAWCDGEAAGDEVVRARAHLPQCPACRATLGRFQQLRSALRSTASARPPRLRGRGRRVLATGALAAAAAVLLLGAWSLHRTGAVLVDEVEVRHLTAFAKAAPCDFESSDPETVKHWVLTQFGYDVDVPIVPGARLLGVRRCRLSGRNTVSLLYRRGDEPLSLFLPRTGSPADTQTARLSRAGSGCTVGRLGAAACARPGLFAVAETAGSARAALESF